MTPLATKYRPASFDQIIGQEKVIAALKQRRSAKAYLFIGPSGVGKTTLARILANDFAGCKATLANIIEVDAATNSGADAMRDVVVRAHNRAIGASPIKTIIVDEVQKLSSSAWSSLLKPIEEPPVHVSWILCTTDAGKIPETIKTRCVTFVLKPVDEVLIYELLNEISLKESIKAPEEVLEAIAENCGGSPRQALVDLELCASAKNANEARQLMQKASMSEGPITLARLLIGKRPPTWPSITKAVNSIDADAESIRIVVVNYFAGALAKAKSESEAFRLLGTLDCFSTPYNQSDKKAPLFISIGLALNLTKGG